MSVQPNFPTVNKPAYNCASCYSVANVYTSVPFNHCVESCRGVPPATRQCIKDAVAKNALALPENMSCVGSEIVNEREPVNQCQTQCIAVFNQCTNDPSRDQSKCASVNSARMSNCSK